MPVYPGATQMISRHPIPQRRRQQEHLIPINRDEVLSHPESLLKPPDDQTRIYPTATSNVDSRDLRAGGRYRAWALVRLAVASAALGTI